MNRFSPLLRRHVGHAALYLSAAFAIAGAALVTHAALSADDDPVLWIAESRGVLSVDQGTGDARFEIPISPDVRALSVDGVNKTVWAFSDKELKSYDFGGALKSSTSLSPPAGNPALLLVDPQARRVWLAVQTQVYLLDDSGSVLTQFRLPQPVIDITLDRQRSQLWLAHKGRVAIYDQGGALVNDVNSSDLKVIRALDYDVKHDLVWLAADESLRRYSPDGSLSSKTQNSWFGGVGFVAADQQGGVWAASARQLASINGAGDVAFVLTPFGGNGPDFIVDLLADPKDHSAWIASPQRVARYATSGALVSTFAPSLSDGKNRLIRQLALETAPIAPQIGFTSPGNNSFVNTRSPTLHLSYTGEQIDLNSLRLFVNGGSLAVSCNIQANSASCNPQQPFADGVYDLAATIADTSGNVSQPAQLHITVDTIAPTVSVTNPPDGTLTNQKFAQITGQISEASALTINGVSVATTNRQFAYAASLVEGSNTFQLRATDAASNVGTKAFGITLDTAPPPAPASSLIETQASDGQITVTGKVGSVEGGSRITVTNLRTGQQVSVTASADGSFSALIQGEVDDVLRITATDAAGNTGTATSITVTAPPGSEPVRLTIVSPANGATVSGNSLLVKVAVQGPANTGLVVNDAAAAIVPSGTGFVYYASVPLVDGVNSVVATATAPDGRTATRSIIVSRTSRPAFEISVTPFAGVSPHSVAFEVADVQQRGINRVVIDVDSNGTVDLDPENPHSEITHTYSGTPGLKQARVSVVDDSGAVYSETVSIVLLDAAHIDLILRGVWSELKTALIAGDVPRALKTMSADSHATYGPVFEALLPHMAEILDDFTEIQRMDLSSEIGAYVVMTSLNGQARVFVVQFLQGADGIWRLDSL